MKVNLTEDEIHWIERHLSHDLSVARDTLRRFGRHDPAALAADEMARKFVDVSSSIVARLEGLQAKLRSEP